MSVLFDRAGVTPDALAGDADISSISADSRAVTPGALFVCMPSASRDSHDFLEDAVSSGAVAALAHSAEGFHKAKSLGIAAALVENTGLKFNEALWRICRTFYDSPSRDMKVAGITGTNGKTTVAWLMRDMLSALGVSAGYLGTLGFEAGKTKRELANTTPFAVDLYRMLDEARSAGLQALAMEVSSHALAERRVDGVEFDAAVFTNLTQDHLDYHGTMAKYEAAKMRLFTELPKQTDKQFRAALNVDDPVGAKWAAALPAALQYGEHGRDLAGAAEEIGVDHIKMLLDAGGEKTEAHVPLGGTFNFRNCLSAAAGMMALGYSIEQIGEALPHVRPVPGRFEPVQNNRGIGVIVDYAHTPDALVKLLDSVRELRPARIWTVFGCGGDRDKTKRPLMAKAASERSDVTVITSDNPRTEDPAEIVKEVESGLVANADAVAILDRRQAISYSLSRAKPGDVVVIAGKGHENYQIIGSTKYPMDDREIAREVLSSR